MVAGRHFEKRIPAIAEAPTGVRRDVESFLAAAGVPERRRREALLVIHELVANAIEHGSGVGDEVEVRCVLESTYLRVEVFDDAHGPSIPAAYTTQSERQRGRGLHLVDRLSDSWCETIIGGRRRVTARLSLQPCL